MSQVQNGQLVESFQILNTTDHIIIQVETNQFREPTQSLNFGNAVIIKPHSH